MTARRAEENDLQDAIIRWGDKQVSDKNGKILSIDGLKVTYGGESGKNPLRAVDGVSLDVGKGESVGLVGESGCGKSSLANAVMGLVPATGGTIAFQGNDVTAIASLWLRGHVRPVGGFCDRAPGAAKRHFHFRAGEQPDHMAAGQDEFGHSRHRQLPGALE